MVTVDDVLADVPALQSFVRSNDDSYAGALTGVV